MGNDEIVLFVCGGRHYDDQGQLHLALDAVSRKFTIKFVMTGAASGADTLALRWAQGREIMYIGVPAEWTAYGKPAGMMRNRRMIDLLLPYCPNVRAVACPGGPGTEGMVSLLKKHNIPVWMLPDKKRNA